MRKITEQAALAFKNCHKFSSGNTCVTSYAGVTQMYLHGNLIAYRDSDSGLRVSLAGWPTPTTRERLNGLLVMLGKSEGFSQMNFKQYFGSFPCSDRDWIVVSLSH